MSDIVYCPCRTVWGILLTRSHILMGWGPQFTFSVKPCILIFPCLVSIIIYHIVFSVFLLFFHRDERQLLLVVRSLYRFLPDDAQILPAQNTTTKTSIQKALKAVQTEIKNISASISGSASAFQGTDFQGGGGDAPLRHSELPPTTAPGDIPFGHTELPTTTTLGEIERKTDLAIGALAL